MTIDKIVKKFAAKLADLEFTLPTYYCYNPLEYAYQPAKSYCDKYGKGQKEVLLLGMNPGPFGMAQTGVPFGDITFVRDWLGIEEQVGKPLLEHPKRPIDGFNCKRSEVSGQRLWGWAKKRYLTSDKFFSRYFVWNYCPLCFMEESGKNRTPDKLPPLEREQLFPICDWALTEVIKELNPKFLVGVGKFAEDRFKAIEAGKSRIVGRILHPSPASPMANAGWDKAMEKQLVELGVRL